MISEVTNDTRLLKRKITMAKTHGLSVENKRLYKIWKEMRYRCNNPKNKSFPRYGGRGIKVCKEWNDSFVPFYEWAISNGYKEDIAESGRNRLSIDRIDNNGNYTPENCRWVNDYIQSRNKRISIPDSERYTNCPICGKVIYQISRNHQKTCSYACSMKLRKIEHPNLKDYTKICPVCNKPFNAKRNGHYKNAICCSRKCANLSCSPIWVYKGESHRVTEWAEIIGINAHCLLHRKELGWSIEEALTTPLRGKRNAK